MNSKSIHLFQYKLVQKSNKPANVEIEAKILIYTVMTLVIIVINTTIWISSIVEPEIRYTK